MAGNNFKEDDDEDFTGNEDDSTGNDDYSTVEDATMEEITTEEDDPSIVRDSDDLINCLESEEPICNFVNNIELTNWIPIRMNGTTLKGNSHIILLESLNKTDSGFIGIFTKLSNVEIIDLKIEVANNFEYTLNEGETFGFLAGEISENVVLEGISIITHNITINSTTESMVGLLAGTINSSPQNEVKIDRFSIPNYYKYTNVVFNGKYNQIGLLAGESENVKIENSYISLNNVIINTDSQSNKMLFSMMLTGCTECEIFNSFSRLTNLKINTGVNIDITGFIGHSVDNTITNSFILFPKIYFDEIITKASLHTANRISGFLLDNENTKMIGCYAIITLDTRLYNNLPNIDFSGFTMIENGNSSYINCYIQIRGFTDIKLNDKSIFIGNIIGESDEIENNEILLSQCLLELYNNENEWKFISTDENEIIENKRRSRILYTDLNKIEIENNTYIYGNINIDAYENITKLTIKDYESENIINLQTSNIDGYWSYYNNPVTGEKKLRLSRLIFPIWHKNGEDFIFAEPIISHDLVEDAWDMNIWSIDSNGQIFNNGNGKIDIKMKKLVYKHKQYCPNFCSNHGTCGNRGKCICNQGFIGIDCSNRVCPSSVVISKDGNSDKYPTECSSHGVCNRQTGKCECEKGYEGFACHRVNCPNNCRDVSGRCLRFETLKSYEKEQVKEKYIEVYGQWDVYQEYVCLPNSL